MKTKKNENTGSNVVRMPAPVPRCSDNLIITVEDDGLNRYGISQGSQIEVIEASKYSYDDMVVLELGDSDYRLTAWHPFLPKEKIAGKVGLIRPAVREGSFNQ